jgi:hypothetical protein
MQALGAYTTRNAPAPENGDEIVAGPIEAANYFAQLLRAILSICDARDARHIVL